MEQRQRYVGEKQVEEWGYAKVKTLRTWRLRGKGKESKRQQQQGEIGPPWKKFGSSVRYSVEGLEKWAKSREGGGDDGGQEAASGGDSGGQQA